MTFAMLLRETMDPDGPKVYLASPRGENAANWTVVKIDPGTKYTGKVGDKIDRHSYNIGSQWVNFVIMSGDEAKKLYAQVTSAMKAELAVAMAASSEWFTVKLADLASDKHPTEAEVATFFFEWTKKVMAPLYPEGSSGRSSSESFTMNDARVAAERLLRSYSAPWPIIVSDSSVASDTSYYKNYMNPRIVAAVKAAVKRGTELKREAKQSALQRKTQAKAEKKTAAADKIAAEIQHGKVGTCPVCESNQRLRGQRLVLHGYQRPGDGAGAIGRCPGVDELAYQISAEGCEKYLRRLKNSMGELQARINGIPRMTSVSRKPRRYSKDTRTTIEKPGNDASREEVEEWKSALGSYEANLQSEVRLHLTDIARMKRLIADWKPGVLGETSFMLLVGQMLEGEVAEIVKGHCRPGTKSDPRSGRCIPVRRSMFKGKYKFGAKRTGIKRSRPGGSSFGKRRTASWGK